MGSRKVFLITLYVTLEEALGKNRHSRQKPKTQNIHSRSSPCLQDSKFQQLKYGDENGKWKLRQQRPAQIWKLKFKGSRDVDSRPQQHYLNKKVCYASSSKRTGKGCWDGSVGKNHLQCKPEELSSIPGSHSGRREPLAFTKATRQSHDGTACTLAICVFACVCTHTQINKWNLKKYQLTLKNRKGLQKITNLTFQYQEAAGVTGHTRIQRRGRSRADADVILQLICWPFPLPAECPQTYFTYNLWESWLLVWMQVFKITLWTHKGLGAKCAEACSWLWNVTVDSSVNRYTIKHHCRVFTGEFRFASIYCANIAIFFVCLESIIPKWGLFNR